MTAKAKEEPVLWRVGFAMDSLSLVTLMSGLVRIHDISYNKDKLFFLVENLDKTNTLFKTGRLRAMLITAREKVKQPLMVDLTPG